MKKEKLLFFGPLFLTTEESCLKCKFFDNKCLGSIESNYCYITSKDLTFSRFLKKQMQSVEINGNRFLLARILGEKLGNAQRKTLAIEKLKYGWDPGYKNYLSGIEKAITDWEQARTYTEHQLQSLREQTGLKKEELAQ